MISAQFSLFNWEQYEAIHHSSLDIWRRAGVRILHDGALSLLRETDAVITDRSLVRFPVGVVEWALKQAASRISLSERGSNPRTRLNLCGQIVQWAEPR